MEVVNHKHFTSSMLFAIWSMFFSAFFASFSVFFATSPIFPAMAILDFTKSGYKTSPHKAGNLMDGLLTFFVLNSRLVNLSYDHPDLLVYQRVQSFERILNICPSQQFPEIDF